MKTISGILEMCDCVDPSKNLNEQFEIEEKFEDGAKFIRAICKKCKVPLKTVKGDEYLNKEVLEKNEKILEDEKTDYLTALE